MDSDFELPLSDKVVLDLELGSPEVLERMDVPILVTLRSPGEPPRLAFINDAALRLLGYQREELTGQSPAFLRSHGSSGAWALDEIFDCEEGAMIETALRRKDGTEQPLLIQTSAHQGAWGWWVIGCALPIERPESRSAHEREPHDPRKLRVGDLTLEPETRWLRYGECRVELTPSECLLLETLMRRAGSVVQRADLYDQLWGFSPAVRTRAVDVYAGSLRRKLRNLGAPEVIHTVRGVGYLLDE